jgi:hypothetical protein
MLQVYPSVSHRLTRPIQEETPLEAARRQVRILEEAAQREAAEQERRRNEQEALEEAERRRKGIFENLQTALKRYRLVIIIGAGVTMGATSDESWNNPPSRTTWKGLIMNGLDYLVQEKYLKESDTMIQAAKEMLRRGDLQSVLLAANITKTQLSERGKYATWLETVFHNLHDNVSESHRAIYTALETLQKRGATLLTTNYDNLLEHFCKLQSVGRSNTKHILEFRSGKRKGVFHIHGSYLEPEEVVLDAIDYFAVKQSDEVQKFLQSLLDDKTVLFVGCGGGLEDPNFHSLLKWASERHRNMANIHYLMLRDGDPHDHEFLLPVRYGPGYGDMVLYLNRLLELPSQATTSDTIGRRVDCE